MRQYLVLLLALAVASCGGDDKSGTGTPPPASTHKLSGTIQGLTGSGLILRRYPADDIAIPANATSFEFATRIGHNESYQIQIRTSPTGQRCYVVNAAGTAQADVSNVRVDCYDPRTYTVTSSAGPNGSISPSGSVSVVAGENAEFVATPDPGYVVDQWTNAAVGPGGQRGPNKFIFYGVNADTGVRVTFRPALLTANVSMLALSVNDVATNPALTGTPRSIVITNNSTTTTATNVTVSIPNFFTGTTVTSSTCGPTLVPGATCSLTVTPGAMASPSCTFGWVGTPDKITVSANEQTTPLSIGVVVLRYGCAYQGGLVFAIDDTTPATGNVGGKVATFSDQYTGYLDNIVWSSDNLGGNAGHVDYQRVGVDRNSVSPCVGDEDGECNVATILAHYSAATYSRALFAAGICERLNTTSTAESALQVGWYLPAHCEANVCGTNSQSMQANLVDFMNLNLLSGTYWTSTESAESPTTQAQVAVFAPGQRTATALDKKGPAHVRCVRKLTY